MSQHRVSQHRGGYPEGVRRYAATAQAEYKDGEWTGSIGLPSQIFAGRFTKKFAEQKAKAFYNEEWLKEKPFSATLVKLHIHVEEL